MGSCCHHDHEKEEKKNHKLFSYLINIVGIVLFMIAILSQFVYHTEKSAYFYLYLASYIFIGYEIMLNAFKRLFKKDMFDENFLMTIATVGAFFIGEYVEGIAVLLFYKVGEFLQDLAVERSKKRIESVLDVRPKIATLKVGDKVESVNPESVKVGDYLVVKTGDKVPLDGVIEEGHTTLDMSALNGESIPREVQKGEAILSGAINLGSVITVKVTKEYEDSTVSKMIALIQNATSMKSNTEKFITKFAKVYTPIVTFLAVAIAIVFPFVFSIPFSEALARALTFLVVSCPCALVVSVPLSFFVGIGACGKKGILIKGSNYLDVLSHVDTVVFDKTGTLTKGIFTVTDIISTNNLTKEEVLEKIAYCESYSNHYIAKSIVTSYGKEMDHTKVSSHEEVAGNGIRAVMEGQQILVGNQKWMHANKIEVSVPSTVGTVVYLAIDGCYQGYIVLSDELKEDSKQLAQNLRKVGIEQVGMLTGDSREIAEGMAKILQLDQVYAELLPQDKVNILEEMKKDPSNTIAYVGDGINDGPVIALADVGIAMGKGTDIAIETADVVLMTDEPSQMIEAMKIAKKTRKIVIENITFALGVKVLFLLLSSLGLANMWWAVFADVGVSLIAILNCMRIFKVK